MELARFLTKSDVHIRWMIRKDMPEVLEIERLSFASAWDEDDLLSLLRERNVIAMVAERPGGRLAGYMLYELRKREIYLMRFVVHPDDRRSGVGRAMLDRLIMKLSVHRRTRLSFHVRDDNLAAQRFYREQGIKAVVVERDHYGPGEDAYLFAHEYGEDA